MYITNLTLNQLPLGMRLKYNGFINDGSLIVMDSDILDMEAVYEDLDNFIINEVKYDVRCVGYDPYNAPEFLKRWVADNGDFNIEKVIQGAKTESVPLGELKHLAEERKLVFDQDIMTFTMGNSVALQDLNGNLKLSKERYSQKIDSVSAMMDAFIAFKLHRENF